MIENNRPLENCPKKQRLWIISEVYYPESTSTGYYLTAIAEGLAGRFDVKVLCGQPNYFNQGVRAPKTELHNGADIFRATGTTLDKNIILFKLVNMLTLGISMFINGLRRFSRHDRVLVVTTPPIMPFLIAAASLVRGASYTLLIHDSYPETLIAVGKLKHASFAARLMDLGNRWLYKNAARIVVVGRDMKTLVENKARGLDVPVEIIPNWAEVDLVQPRPRSENGLIRELGIQDKLVILHAGNIGYPTDVETLIECLADLSDDARFHFVFVGSGVKEPLLESAITDLGLKNLSLLKPRPRTEQIEFLNACDIGLVSLVNGMYGAAMPSKTYNIMAAGKPVLALTDPGSELALLIDEEKIGWHLPAGDTENLKATLNEIYDSRDDLHEIGTRARIRRKKDIQWSCRSIGITKL